ncbi:MAG: YcfL family protein [Rhodoferax sp.]
MNVLTKLLLTLATSLALSAHAQHDPGTSPAIAAKVALRGDANGVRIPEIRVVRRNDILIVQADLTNMGNTDRTLFYRFRWLDTVGNQVGDGESWKQMGLLGQAQQTVKSVAPSSVATDFRLELNVESR